MYKHLCISEQKGSGLEHANASKTERGESPEPSPSVSQKTYSMSASAKKTARRNFLDTHG